MSNRAIVTINTKDDRDKVARWAHQTNAGTVVEFRKKSRSTEQNAKLWAMLGEVSEQVVWYGQKLTPADWKTMFTASLRKANVLPGIDAGTVVPLGISTSSMTVDEMSNLIALMDAFGADPEHLVIFKSEESSESTPRAPAEDGASQAPSTEAEQQDPPPLANGQTDGPASISSSQEAGSPLPKEFKFTPKELTDLKDFARKALDTASDTTMFAPAKLFDIEGLEVGYADALSGEEASIALKALLKAVDAVTDGKRTRSLAADYIARDILGCAAAELEGRK